MFRAKFPSISSHISQNATPGTQLARCHHPTLTGRFTKNTRSETSEVMRLPRKMTTRISKVLRRSTHLLKTTRTCHKKTTRYETCWCWNVTKRHACHAKRGYATFETSKSDCFCRTRHRHSHITLTTVARGHLRTVEGPADTFQPPNPK